MKALLQNKWVVALLALASLGAILGQNPGWLHSSGLEAAAREGAEADPTVDSAIVTTNSPARYLTEMVNWKQLFPDSELRRDPFAVIQKPSAEGDQGSDAGRSPRGSSNLFRRDVRMRCGDT